MRIAVFTANPCYYAAQVYVASKNKSVRDVMMAEV